MGWVGSGRTKPAHAGERRWGSPAPTATAPLLSPWAPSVPGVAPGFWQRPRGPGSSLGSPADEERFPAGEAPPSRSPSSSTHRRVSSESWRFVPWCEPPLLPSPVDALARPRVSYRRKYTTSPLAGARRHGGSAGSPGPGERGRVSGEFLKMSSRGSPCSDGAGHAPAASGERAVFRSPSPQGSRPSIPTGTAPGMKKGKDDARRIGVGVTDDHRRPLGTRDRKKRWHEWEGEKSSEAD